MNSLMFRVAVLTALLIFPGSLRARIGASIPWRTYEAEDMKTTGVVLGPKYDPYLVETESSGQKCVKLAKAGQYVEFTVQSPANTLVVRYSLPDAPAGGGIHSTLNLYQNGKLVKNLPITSHYSWLYGKYPFTNDPKAGKPRDFYDEVRVKGLTIAKGDVIRLEKPEDQASYCIVDLVDLENIAPPLTAPKNTLSLAGFGADGTGRNDDTAALRNCISESRKQGKIVWVPAGVYRIAGDIIVPSNVTIQGAGMWYTTLVGDARLYGQPDRRVRFKLSGNHIHLADFAIIGKLNYRKDNEPNDAIMGAHCDNSTISNIWVEHTKVGMWFYVCSNVVVSGCRFRDTLADGINLCVDTRNCVVQNCTTRNTGDDCFAMWPAASDQSFVQQSSRPGNNIFRNCTGELPFLANGAAVYGGSNNCVEDCVFQDISPGCGILLSSTFPTSDESGKIDNNFSGTTVVRNCNLIRCGGYDHDWEWRAAFQLCLDRRSISGVEISNVNIVDSLSDGLSVVAPGSKHGQGTLSNVHLEDVTIPNYGIGTGPCHGLWIRNDAQGSLTIAHSEINGIKNSSTNFSVIRDQSNN